MYYYIIEPSKGKFSNRQEKVRDILGNLGIAGETVTPNSARTIEELTHLGIVKGYSTIVACGSESLVNKVITVLATENLTKDTVLGVIPNEFDTPLVRKLGITDIYSACNALKSRKLDNVSLCFIEPNKYFLTEAIIESSHNKELFFSIENINGKANVHKVVIKPGLEVTLYDKSLEGGILKKFYQWLFNKKEKDIYTSSFQTKRIRFESEKENLPVKVSNEIVAKTPVTFSNHARSLKIIVARDRIRSERKEYRRNIKSKS